MVMILGAWLCCFTEFIILCKPSTDTGPAICQSFSTSVLHFVMCQHSWIGKMPMRNYCSIERLNGTFIFLLKFLSFRFFIYLWIFSFLSSGDKRTTLNVESSNPDSSVGGNVAAFPLHPFIRCWLFPPTCSVNIVLCKNWKWFAQSTGYRSVSECYLHLCISVKCPLHGICVAICCGQSFTFHHLLILANHHHTIAASTVEESLLWCFCIAAWKNCSCLLIHGSIQTHEPSS